MSVTSVAEPAQRVVPFAARLVVPIAAIVAVAHCAAAAFGDGYWFDEVSMVAIGRHHLDWGSADQPPLAPALAALIDAMAPGSGMVLRLPAVISSGRRSSPRCWAPGCRAGITPSRPGCPPT